MSDLRQLIREWLNEYTALQENEIKSFAAEHEHNHEIATAIFNLFFKEEEELNDYLSGTQDIDEEVNKSKEVELQRFTLQFIPTLINNYLSSIAVGNSKANRLKVMAALLFIYNCQLSLLPKLSLRHFCIAASRIVNQGFYKKQGTPKSKPIQRVPVSSNFLLEMIEGAYFSMFNEFYTLAFQAIKDIDQRAQYELLPEVMLVTSAVINSLKNNPSGQPCDGPMGISVALSPATTTVTMSKSMITNASFHDIPIQPGQAVAPDTTDILTAISEEVEAESATHIQRGIAGRNSKPKLTSAFPVLGKKPKDSKDKITEKKVTLKESSSTEKKITLKESSKSIWGTISGGGDSMVEAQQKTTDSHDGSGSQKDEISMTSVLNSTETSDSRSQVTTDSLDTETSSRIAGMQVSSV
ncbi:unnamed protein product [Leptidea sinapis]|uniref:Hyccin n=1 Tax=Leptidea sinapis TaxID=189913 RepID=A0A5E4QZH2_9NEOP|nr:unnamed protein product [Leptidea sinapis]